jgi:hypothetical protein
MPRQEFPVLKRVDCQGGRGGEGRRVRHEADTRAATPLLSSTQLADKSSVIGPGKAPGARPRCAEQAQLGYKWQQNTQLK